MIKVFQVVLDILNLGRYQQFISNNLLHFLEEWYESQCDEDWEHEFGIAIDTLDNPGWTLAIDLAGTECENQPFNEINWEKDENNWVQCNVVNNQFLGSGGPRNLQNLIQIFFDWRNSFPNEK